MPQKQARQRCMCPLVAKLAKGCRCFPPAGFHQDYEMPFCRDLVSNCFPKPFCKAIEPFCRAPDHAATYFAYFFISCSLAARTDPLVAPAALQTGRSSSTTCLWVFFNFWLGSQSLPQLAFCLLLGHLACAGCRIVLSHPQCSSFLCVSSFLGHLHFHATLLS